jgi:hypothetical protein
VIRDGIARQIRRAALIDAFEIDRRFFFERLDARFERKVARFERLIGGFERRQTLFERAGLDIGDRLLREREAFERQQAGGRKFLARFESDDGLC